MKKRWSICKQDHELQRTLSKELSISPITSQILINRGITDPKKAKEFLAPQLSQLHPPEIMRDMDKAVKRIVAAISNKEKILIFGDYDVDGVTAVSILILFLRETGVEVLFKIPHRQRDGYGLNVKAIKEIKALGVKLLITVDCGISDHQEIALANDLNIDVIITDHHHVPGGLPAAIAILNPLQKGCPFPFKHLAGVGVAFYLIIALRAALRKIGFWEKHSIPNLKKYLDLVALGTISDVVPLTGVNRIIVKYGLLELTDSSRPGIIALKEVSGLSNNTIDTRAVAYRLAPRINAAGRMGQAESGVKLLTISDPVATKETAIKLNEENMKRQKLEETILRETEEIIRENQQMLESKVIVLAKENWHSGVIGIVASRLVDKYYKPTILISLKNGIGKGSARSIEAFHLYEGLALCREFLENFGGHSQAAGLTIKKDALKNFITYFEKVVISRLNKEDFTPRFHIDAQINLKDITEELIAELEMLTPFGHANPSPVLVSSKLKPQNYNVVGKGHLKFKLKEGDRVLDAIGFGMGNVPIDQDQLINIAFTPHINRWQGIKSIQLKLEDIVFNE